MKSIFRRLREPSTHSALAVGALTLAPLFGVNPDIANAIGALLVASGVILPERAE